MKQFVIKGNPEQIKQAQAEIAKIVGVSGKPELDNTVDIETLMADRQLWRNFIKTRAMKPP